MNSMNPKVDGYIRYAKKWQHELKALRTILLDAPLTEDWKWGHPCYTFENNNVVIIGELKDCCTLSFFKGVLLKDPAGVLAPPGPNSRSARVMRFTGVQRIKELEPTLNAYIREAIEIEKDGRKVDFQQGPQVAMPAEFAAKLAELPALKKAFEALTPGRQRAYLLHFSGAKQSKTRASRVEKCIPRILEGEGLND